MYVNIYLARDVVLVRGGMKQKYWKPMHKILVTGFSSLTDSALTFVDSPISMSSPFTQRTTQDQIFS